MNSPARTRPEKNAETRQRLLLTALHLYARDGVHAVSLRRISAEAGSKNSAAMHYHFDNKLGVIQALVEMVTRELEQINEALRAEQAANPSLRDAWRDYLRPLAQLPERQPWGADGVSFLSRLVSDSDEEIAAMVNRIYAPFWQRLDHALEKQLPELPTPVRQLRLMFMTTNVLHGIADATWLSHTPLGDMSYFDQDTLLDHLVDYLIGGLQAPSLAATEPMNRES